MVEVNLKSLLARLDRYCSRSLEAAAGLCVSRTNYEVTTEHLMHALIDDATADVQQIFKQFGVDPGRVQKSLTTVIEALKTGNSGRPTFSPTLIEWIQQSWLLASLDFGLAEIRSGILPTRCAITARDAGRSTRMAAAPASSCAIRMRTTAWPNHGPQAMNPATRRGRLSRGAARVSRRKPASRLSGTSWRSCSSMVPANASSMT